MVLFSFLFFLSPIYIWTMLFVYVLEKMINGYAFLFISINMYLYSIICKSFETLHHIIPEITDRCVEKIGCTTCIKWRKFGDGQTFNVFPLTYKWYFKINDLGEFNSLIQLEKTVHSYYYFKKRHLNKSGGTEFFHFGEFESSLQKVSDILLDYGVRFEIFEKDIFTNRPLQEPPKDYINHNKSQITPLSVKNKPSENEIVLRPYQQISFDKMKENNKGILILPTGVGKTIIFISYLYQEGGNNLVLVPTKKLVNQTYKVAVNIGIKNVIKCYSDTTFEENKYDNSLIISTYQSSDKLIHCEFNTIIFDECHTTVISYYKKDIILK